jgi:ribosomal protein S27E
MQATLAQQTFRGVSCRHCGHPIRVTPSILTRERSFKNGEPNFTQQWCSQMFSHRCRTCGNEAIYALSHILDFENEQVVYEQSASAGL